MEETEMPGVLAESRRDSLQRLVKRKAFEGKNSVLRGEAWRRFGEARSVSTLPPALLDEILLRRLRRITDFAHASSPHYAGELTDTRSLTGAEFRAAWLQVPILDRATLQKSFDEIATPLAQDHNARVVTTGGSTGAPVKVLSDPEAHAEVLGWEVSSRWGVHPADNAAHVLRIYVRSEVINTLTWWPTRRAFLDASKMSEVSMLDFVEKCNRIRPVFLQGYVGGLLELATFLFDEGLRLPQPNAVSVTAAPSTAAQRSFMERVFRAPVYDQYGMSEVTWIAAECKSQSGLHVLEPFRFVEVVNDDGIPVEEGEIGRLLVTDTTNFSFPLLRYDTGDRGRVLSGACPCGLPGTRIDSVLGRVSETVRLPNGDRIAGEYLTTIFDPFPDAVSAFQVNYFVGDSIEIIYIPSNSPASPQQVESVRQALATKCAGSVAVRAREVDRINHDAGKTRFVRVIDE